MADISQVFQGAKSTIQGLYQKSYGNYYSTLNYLKNNNNFKREPVNEKPGKDFSKITSYSNQKGSVYLYTGEHEVSKEVLYYPDQGGVGRTREITWKYPTYIIEDKSTGFTYEGCKKVMRENEKPKDGDFCQIWFGDYLLTDFNKNGIVDDGDIVYMSSRSDVMCKKATVGEILSGNYDNKTKREIHEDNIGMF